MKRLGAADKIFLLAERRESPMHVGGLNLFTLPDGADEQRFLHGLADNLRMADAFQHPFGERLKVGRAGLLGPASWVEDTSLDLDYHIRHSALPRPGRAIGGRCNLIGSQQKCRVAKRSATWLKR